MPKGYRIGRKHLTQELHDDEISRYVADGLTDVDIAARLKVSSKTIQRARKRLGQKGLDAQKLGEQVRQFKKLGFDEYSTLPDLAQWLEGCRARHVGQKRISRWTSMIKQICEFLEIYPSMLDIPFCQKWLAANDNMTLKQLRHWKNAMRSFLTGSGRATPLECTNAGIDSKHYGDSDFAQVKLSEAQIAKGIELLQNDPRALAVFRIGTECCCPAQEILAIKKSSFIDFAENGTYWLRIRRGKTESDWTKKPAPETVKLFQTLEVLGKNDCIFTLEELYPKDPKEASGAITGRLRNIYKQIDATDRCFTVEPIHALRHAGAQRILRKTNWNRTATARLGGWLAEITLEKHYGAMPDELVREIGAKLW